jgi:hypothetical protein
MYGDARSGKKRVAPPGPEVCIGIAPMPLQWPGRRPRVGGQLHRTAKADNLLMAAQCSTCWDAKAQRLVVTSNIIKDRLFLLKLDQATGSIAIDDAFRDTDGKAGINFVDREWPHGWKGTGLPHGVVFSR